MRPGPVILLLPWVAASASCAPSTPTDPCDDPGVAANCEAAQRQIETCCAGTISSRLGPILAPSAALTYCQALVVNSRDAGGECAFEQALTCEAMHPYIAEAYPEGCCCPEGEFCDYGTWPDLTCVPLCQSSSDCADPARPACAPAAATVNGALQIVSSYICVAADGAPFHGCVDGGCTSNDFVCALDTRANSFCTTACSADQFCGDFGQGCCNVTEQGTSENPPQACGHCGEP